MTGRFALILGGTKGLGRELAIGCIAKGITPIIAARSTRTALKDPALPAAIFRELDLADAGKTESALAFYRMILGGGPIFTHVFWVAGIFLRKPFTDCTPAEIARMTAVHFTGPLRVLAEVHRMQKLAKSLADEPGAPYHLVTIGSTSSWKVRENEAVYCALKSAKTHFTRNFARELFRDLPGSKVTLVNPGGIRTPTFWEGTGADISAYMDPAELSRAIWSAVDGQTGPFAEVQVLRGDVGQPVVSIGPRGPELP